MLRPPFPKPSYPPRPFPKPYIRYLSRPKELTYIFGARCKDGVVLVADRKIMVGDTGDFYYGEKLFPSHHPIVWGSSGWTMFSDSFNNRANVEVRNLLLKRRKEGEDAVLTIEEFRIIVEEVYERMAQLHGDRIRYGGLSILVAHRAYAKAELWLIEQFGTPQRQNGYAGIGSGANHASLFTRRDFFRPEESTIKQAAEVGYFVIKYIEKLKIDNAVGVGERFPQVWFLPDEGEAEKESWDDKKRHEATEQELASMESTARKRLLRFETNLKDFWTVSD